MTMALYPLRFEPRPKVRVWGGSALAARTDGDLAGPVGESWEIADHGEDVSRVASGPLRGRTLRELIASDTVALLGGAIDPHRPDRFPLLLKLLDARDLLSVQVHPDDAQAAAAQPGELGKTEAWYILEADPEAYIYRGVREGVGEIELRRALEEGTAADLLKRVPVRAGDAYFLPAGMIHALGPGIRLAEIQQNSDTTYRLFDWNRTGLDGKPRPLHIDEGLAVARFGAAGPDRCAPERLPCEGCIRERFVCCEKFALERLTCFTGEAALETASSFHIVTALTGAVTVRTGSGTERLTRWESCLLPAACGRYTVSGEGAAAALLFHVPAGKP